MANNVTWTYLAQPGQQAGEVGGLRLFQLHDGDELDLPGEVRLFIRFPSDYTTEDGRPYPSEEAAKAFAEELFEEFYRKLHQHVSDQQLREDHERETAAQWAAVDAGDQHLRDTENY